MLLDNIIFYSETILFIIIILVKILRQIKLNGLRPTIRNAFIAVETKYLHGQNSEKFNDVLNFIYNKIGFLKVIISKNVVEKFIQDLFDEYNPAFHFNSNNDAEVINTNTVDATQINDSEVIQDTTNVTNN